MNPRPRSTAKRATSTSSRPKTTTRKASTRITQAQLVRQLFRLASIQRSARSSIQLSTGPRGQVQITVNIHAGDEPELTTVDAIQARAVKVFDELRRRYPFEKFE